MLATKKLTNVYLFWKRLFTCCCPLIGRLGIDTMIHPIVWCLARSYRFRSCIAITLATIWGPQVWSQSIDTQPLAVTSICAGSQLEVTGRKLGVTGDLAVEISSNGTTFSTLPSVPISTSASNEVIYRATIPANTSAGNSYRIRLVANSSTVATVSSPTVLTVKAKPAPPRVDSLILDCMRVLPSGNLTSTISTTVAVGAVVNLYWYNNNTLGKDDSKNNPNVYRYTYGTYDYVSLGVGKTYSPVSTYKYPVEERRYSFTQIVDGCESDTTKIKWRVLYRPFQGPTPANAVLVSEVPNWPGIYHGRVTYCLGDKAVPLNMNGHATPGENYRVRYELLNSSEQTLSPPLPDTKVSSSKVYNLWLDPIDPAKGCRSFTSSQLTLTVNFPPSATITGGQTLLEWQDTPASLSVTLSGKPPFTFIYQDSSAVGLGKPVSMIGYNSPVIFDVKPRLTTTYKIKSVDNGCLNDTLSTSAVVNVTPLLGIEESVLADDIDVYPVPATDGVMVTINGFPARQTASLQLVDATGHVVDQREIRQETASIPLGQWPSGTYWLRIQLGDRQATKRIVKL